MEPLVFSWSLRGFVFQIDECCFSHAIWCDNIVLFAANLIMMQQMLDEIADAFQEFHFSWKPSSLEVLPAGSLAEDFQYSFRVDQEGRMESYKVVEQITLLGEAIGRYGNSNLSALHRRSCGTSAFYKHRTPLSSHGHIGLRLKAWTSVPQSSAVFGCET